MEGDESEPPSLPDDNHLSELSDRVAENVVVFQQYIDEIIEAIDQDENFFDMTADSYNKKKSSIKSHIRELSQLHNSLADECGDLIESVSKSCQSVIQKQHLQSSDSSSSPQVTQTLAPKFSRATGFDVLWQPGGGGFYLSKVESSSHSGSETSMSSVNKPAVPPVSDDALKVEETKDSGSDGSMSSVNKPPDPPANDDALKVKQSKDPGGVGSDSGSESSMSSVNKPLVPPVNDDALKEKETKDPEESNGVLLEKIFNLEEEVASLKQKLQTVTDENGELKQEIEENIRDIGAYMSASKREIRAMEIELQASKLFAETIDGHMTRLLAEKIDNQSKYDAEITEMKTKMTQYVNEISRLKSTHQKKEKIWNGITDKLKDEIKETSELLAKVSGDMEALIIDKSDQNNLIHKLKTELLSVKFENAGLVPSFENVQKITDELKLKVLELEREVDKEMKAMSERERE
ncbi:hypothetical protein E3N88_03400 [Mikania micrantha]|uniref:NAB domain-containing protein n=1 Tax=Mikania micrantha TaxID=192012 RepID=A0A5N6Q6C6_9ASTR|nr:hypothetical protein E3N88_03400 [Mikania micrantha]